MNSRTSSKTILIVLLVFAAILRVFSMGKYVCMDEDLIWGNITNFLKHRTLLPTDFTYPTLFSYLSVLPTVGEALLLYFSGIIPSPSDIMSLHWLGSNLPLLGARSTSAAFGFFTILVVFNTGKLSFDKRTGLIAAAFLGFSRSHIYLSGYALSDVTMTFFAACTLFFSLAALKSKSTRDFILAGLFAGLTATTKYNGALVILLILPVHLIRLYDEKKILSPRFWINRQLVYSGLAFTAAFFAGSPGWILNPGPFLKTFIEEQRHVSGGHLGSFGLPYLKTVRLFWSFETIAAFFSGLGLFYAAIRRTRQDLIVLIFVFLSFLYVGSWQKQDLHYLLFIYPALYLLSARLVSDLLRKCNGIIARGIVFSVFAGLVYLAGADARRETLPDNRCVAQKWIQRNIPEGSKVAVDWAYIPRLFTAAEKKHVRSEKPAFYEQYVKDIRTYELIPIEYDSVRLSKGEADYLVTSSGCFNRFFKTPAPPSNNPLHKEYNKRKEAYAALFNQPDTAWKLAEKFDKGKGPAILVYKRIWEK